MKILFIGHYRENSGWGRAGQAYIKALNKTGFDISIRPFNLGNPTLPLDEELQDLEESPCKNPNVIVQCVLPHHLEYHGPAHNIALPFIETHDIQYTSWLKRFNLMDEVWCTNSDMLSMSEITAKKTVVPCPFDATKLDIGHPPLIIPATEGTYKFYFVGEFNVRKRLSALLRAFHLEFHPSEPVSLTIKSSKFGWSDEKLKQELDGLCLGVKNNLKLYASTERYHSEVLICSHLSEQQMMGLHTSCNCLVSPSYGESICLPILDALSVGNQVVASNQGGPRDILKEVGYLVDGRWESVFGMTDTFSDLYTGREKWFDISVDSLRENMRQSYEDYNNLAQEQKVMSTLKRINRVREYSYENVGMKIKEILSERN